MTTDVAPGERGSYARGRKSREDLVVAAAAVYSDVGYDASSLREIAKRAGLTHAGLLYHFPNKEALLAAVLTRRDRLDSERPVRETAESLGQLAWLLELAEHNERNPSIVELYVRLAAEATSQDHPAHGYFTEHYRVARHLAAEGFRSLQEAGRLRPGVDPEVAAVGLVALMDGLQVQWLTDPATVDLTTALRQYVDQTLASPAAP